MKLKYGSSSVPRNRERPKSDFFKLVWTAVLIVAALVVVALLAATHNVGQLGMKRVLSALIYLFVGAYTLYVTRKHRKYVSQLPDNIGNRKIKRQQTIFLIVGLLFLVAAAWNFWFLASSK